MRCPVCRFPEMRAVEARAARRCPDLGCNFEITDEEVRRGPSPATEKRITDAIKALIAKETA